MHILHTVLYTFQKVLTRRICLMIKSILTLLSFLYSYDLTSSFRGDIVIRNYMLITLRSWELTRGPDDFGMLILYFSHIQVFRCRNFWGRGQGEGVGRVQTTILYLNLALICLIVILHITNYLFLNITDRVLYWKGMFWVIWHAHWQLSQRLMMTFCAKANPFNSQDLIVNSPI